MLIGLHGRARSGKDTIASILVARHAYWRLSFAAPIKDMLIAAGLATRSEVDGDTKEIELPGVGVSPRRLMQTLGTEWGRTLVGPDIWIRLLERKLAHLWQFGNHVVITDVRFANEAEWIRAKGGVIWHVQRRLPGNVVALHASESGVPRLVTDSLIDNNAGLEQLGDEIRAALDGQRLVA